MEPLLGQNFLFAGDFAPKGYAFCNGQLYAIAQNAALFSILGTTYGGDGVTTFALPDLRGRVPVGWGQGPGLTERQLGESYGSETLSERTVGVVAGPALPKAPIASVDAGGDQPSTLPPSLGISFIIATDGVYPSRG